MTGLIAENKIHTSRLGQQQEAERDGRRARGGLTQFSPPIELPFGQQEGSSVTPQYTHRRRAFCIPSRRILDPTSWNNCVSLHRGYCFPKQSKE